MSLKKSGWCHNIYFAPPSQILLPSGNVLSQRESLDLLGTIFTPDGQLDAEIDSRISKMWGRYYQLKDSFCPRSSSLEARIRLFAMTIRRTGTWGAGSWRLHVPQARRLNSAEMDIERQPLVCRTK